MNNTIEAVAPEVALQTWLRPDLTPVGPNKDYAAFRDQLAGRRRGRVAATPSSSRARRGGCRYCA
ncbi:MAG: hypothetical protein J6386_07870 [Candidatus Synoicihabitans palmerolidicus]|nr:hypothetical protein [Candidatus Synoicihabitans palmerolidicus]